MTSDRLDQLLSYTQPGAAQDTAGLAEAVSSMCVDDRHPLAPAEAALAYDILCRLYPDAEMAVRRLLAERLTGRPDIPRALCLMIANDDISIAAPVIRSATQLDDDDLIRLAIEKSRDHQLAVATRTVLSVRVTDVLVYLADGEIALALANNAGADFSEHGLKRLVNASRTQPSLQEPLLRRTDMPRDLAMLMYAWVGQGLKAFIRDSFGIAVAQSVGVDVDAAVQAAQAAHPENRASAFSHDDQADPWPESFINLLVALRRRDLRIVEREAQKLGTLPAHAIQRLLYNGDGKALAVLCRSQGAGRSLFAEVFSRLYGTPPYSSFCRSREFLRAMSFFEQLPRIEADGILQQWRIRPETVWGDANRFNAAWELRRRETEKT